MSNLGPRSTRDEEPRPGPEQRLEWLRFCIAEGQTPEGVLDWMQEAEVQIANLRKRLNDLPKTYARRSPSW